MYKTHHVKLKYVGYIETNTACFLICGSYKNFNLNAKQLPLQIGKCKDVERD